MYIHVPQIYGTTGVNWCVVYMFKNIYKNK
jgi:hypothetical protein